MKLSLSADRFQPGQALTGTLHPEAVGVCEVLLVRLWWAARGPDPDTDEVVVVQEITLAAGALAVGLSIDFAFTLPTDPISHEGTIVSVRWYVTARIRWTGDRKDDVMRQPITVVPGPLPDPVALKADWLKRWKKTLKLGLFDRLLDVVQKHPLRTTAEAASPGEVVELTYAGKDVGHRWRLVRIESAAAREIRENRTGKRTVTTWKTHSNLIAEGRMPLRGEPGTRTASMVIPEDAVASLLLPTRRIRWEIRVSTTGKDVVVPLVVLPGV